MTREEMEKQIAEKRQRLQKLKLMPIQTDDIRKQILELEGEIALMNWQLSNTDFGDPEINMGMPSETILEALERHGR